jgi:hypothetical protein
MIGGIWLTDRLSEEALGTTTSSRSRKGESRELRRWNICTLWSVNEQTDAQPVGNGHGCWRERFQAQPPPLNVTVTARHKGGASRRPF